MILLGRLLSSFSLLHAHTHAGALVVDGLLGSACYLDVELAGEEHAGEVALAGVDGEGLALVVPLEGDG